MEFNNWNWGWTCGLSLGTIALLANKFGVELSWWVFLPAIIIGIIFQVTLYMDKE